MKNVEELEQNLAHPGPELIADMARLEGDLLILGAGGKMGPSLARLARQAILAAGKTKRVIAVSRFSDPAVRRSLEGEGVEILAGDLLDEQFLASLPDCANVLFMAGRKFGTSGRESYTWAMNTYLPGRVANRFRNSRIVAFSTGNVYPLVPVGSGGATEETFPEPLGEYAQSCLGRERMFQYFSHKWGTPVLIFRLNYAIDLRYGVLDEVGRAVWAKKPIDLRMGHVNVIWQGDANSYALRSLLHCTSPASILNITGPEVISVRWLAEEFGRRMDRKPTFVHESSPTALLNQSARAHKLLGPPRVTLSQMIEWTAAWIAAGGRQLGKPTHFQQREGKF